MRFRLPRSRPRSEPPQFAVITIIRHPHLGSDEQDLAIKDDQSTVVKDVLVDHWPVHFS